MGLVVWNALKEVGLGWEIGEICLISGFLTPLLRKRGFSCAIPIYFVYNLRDG